jgi:ATP-binding cassette subfamily F protein uup
MDRLVDHLFVFEGGGVVRDFPGNYSQYRIDERNKEKNKDVPVVAVKETPIALVAKVAEPEKRKLSFKEKREFEQIEKDMPTLEAEKNQIAEKMANPAINYDEIQKLSFRITQITTKLEEMEMRWLELSELMS